MIGHIPYKWLVAAVYVLGIFMNLLDLTITNVALPVMAHAFGVSAASIRGKRGSVGFSPIRFS